MACKSKVPIKVSFRWAEWMFSIGLAIAVILWSAYVFGQNINVNLTDDYNRVQTSEQTLLQDSPKFQNGHLNFDADLDQPMGIIYSSAILPVQVLPSP